MRRAFRRIRALFTRSRLDADIRRELASHLAMETERRARGGLSPEEARRSTLRDFGAVDRVREEVRDVRGVTFWDALAQDVRFGLRALGRSPGYSLAVVLILGLGIGANTAVFSVIDGVLLKSLPFRDAGRLVLIKQSAPAIQVANAGVSIPELFDYRRRLSSVRDLVEYHQMNFVLLDQGEPDRVDTGVVSANFFTMLGVKPLLGRTFLPGEDNLDADAVLVLSHGYWTRKFGADPGVVGRVLEMNNRPHTVVGVLPDFPQYPDENDVYMPSSACPFRAAAQKNGTSHRAFSALDVFGRLAPGVTEEAAASEVATVAASFPADYPNDYRSPQLVGRVASLQGELVVGARPMLIALAGATLLVLLIACANVANLALARTARRQRELAVRTALGAGRGRLLRQLVTESVMLALAGGVLGVALAAGTLRLLVEFVGRFTARTGQIEIDGGVLLFALASAVATGVVFGAAPALSTRRDLAQAVRDGASRGGDSRKRQRVRAGLVVAQVAVSFMLLVGAALLLETFYKLSSVTLGYRTDHVMTAAFYGNFGNGRQLASQAERAARAQRLQDDILTRIRATPGITAAAVTSSVPLSNITPGAQPITIEGGPAADGPGLTADPNVASEGYFEVLDVPVLGGRTFRESDGPEAPSVAVVNQSMAQLWKGRNPVGLRFALPPPQGSDEPQWLTVVGVVADFRLYGMATSPGPEFYTPTRQTAFGGGRLLVRTTGNPFDVVPGIKAAIHGADPTVPVEDLVTLEELRHGRLAAPGLTAALLGVFAAVALAITLAGISGLVGNSVSQRTREFGLRMALGATRGSVLRLVLGQGVMLSLVGIAVGLAGAYGFSQLIAQYLFGTAPANPTAYLAVAVVFFAAALLASFGPARRATSVDPLRALRTE